MKKAIINAESFAQAVVSSHPDHGLNQQLKEYVAAFEIAQKYNAEIIKFNDSEEAKSIKEQNEYLKSIGF